MSKLSAEYEHPGEVACYAFADWISPFFKRLNFTANHITTLANVAAVIAVWAAINKKLALFAIAYTFKYLFDCADGYYARKYKMTSEFGDIYDHVSDLVFVIAMVFVLFVYFGWKDWARPYRGFLIAGFMFMVIISGIHLGCQEAIYSKQTGKSPTKTLKAFVHDCENPERLIKWTRWVGSSFVVVFTALILILLTLQ